MPKKKKTRRLNIGKVIRLILLFVIIAELVLLGIQWKKAQPKELIQTAKEQVRQELADRKADAFEDDADFTGDEKNTKKEDKKTIDFDALDEELLADKSEEEIAAMKQEYKDRFGDNYIIGDSLTEGLIVYGWLTEEQVASKVGASIKAAELFTQAASKSPEKAFFAFGMNDMGNFSNDEDAFIAAYKERLESFHDGSPDSEIYVCSITTPTESAQAGNLNIREYAEFNEAIRAMCKEQNYTYIDITGILPNHPELYAGDGIHAASRYYPLWLERLFHAADID